MPTYVYRREDGSTFEIEQPITEAALETCPTTGQPVRRVISANAGLIFKGEGFYLTDYVRKGQKGEGSGVEEKKSSPDKAAPSEGSAPSAESKADSSKP